MSGSKLVLNMNLLLSNLVWHVFASLSKYCRLNNYPIRFKFFVEARTNDLHALMERVHSFFKNNNHGSLLQNLVVLIKWVRACPIVNWSTSGFLRAPLLGASRLCPKLKHQSKNWISIWEKIQPHRQPLATIRRQCLKTPIKSAKCLLIPPLFKE